MWVLLWLIFALCALVYAWCLVVVTVNLPRLKRSGIKSEVASQMIIGCVCFGLYSAGVALLMLHFLNII